MSFSVLLSLYYKENPAFLRESLDSVFQQTLPPDEVVLVKDGPLTAELERVVSDYVSVHPEIKAVPLTQNQGLGRALNEGLRHCTHDLVARMDTDDICKPDRFLRQVSFMEAHPEIAVCGAWIDEFDSTRDNITSIRKLPESSGEIYSFAQSRNPMNHPVVMFRRSAVERCGGYRHFPLFEDYWLWARMLAKGYKFHNLQESLLWFRTSPDTFRRRGGWHYACTEVRFLRSLCKIGLISVPVMVKNVATRFVIRVLPNHIRGFIYMRLLR